MSVDTDVVIDEKIKKGIKQPKKFNVIMLNDNQTPMEWVMDILKTIFKHNDANAEHLTMTIHTEGTAVVGTYSFEIAEMKSHETILISRNHGFPLMVELEEV